MIQSVYKKWLLLGVGVLLAIQLSGQAGFFQPSDTLHKGRFWTAVGGGAAIYGTVSIGLYNTWYKEFEQTGFHTFNDAGEWLDMDKSGHIFTAYMESYFIHQGARWVGLRPKTAAWVGAATGLFLQTTIEVMDAHSAKWGFSWPDMAANVAGSGIFLVQQLIWEEQRIRLKVSNTPPDYDFNTRIPSLDGTTSTTLGDRAKELYGASFAETFLKDYNGLTAWASFNIHSFLPSGSAKNRIPSWLNLAVGYGAENMYGGFANEWTDEDSGAEYLLPPGSPPRYRQYYLSLDVDFTRIPTRKSWVKTLLSVVSWVKIPAPALEYNRVDGLRGHWVYW